MTKKEFYSPWDFHFPNYRTHKTCWHCINFKFILYTSTPVCQCFPKTQMWTGPANKEFSIVGHTIADACPKYKFDIDRFNRYNKALYFVICIAPEFIEDELAFSSRSRCAGYYYKLKKAVAAVLSNDGDIHEQSYDYAVIERVPEGVMPIDLNEVKWFKWTDEKYVEIEKPKWSEGTVGWSMG